ncbi:nucleotide sugar dehydrogenase [Gorillibacterium sp. CAU 1737]|uniref:UDP-glucose dehydrogenase family protein n=1 Tax=Gorillibacterium sp. CAU 1737 TaxID=3140362 RepID=UPI003261B8CA
MVTVFGLGFVGLTTALGFAEMGHQVYGVEVNQERMNLIKSGRLPFLEPGLDEALTRHLGVNFHPCDDLSKAISKSDYIYYCVGTPYGEDGQADLTYLNLAMGQTLEAIHDDRFRVLVVKSTVPPSTTQNKVIPFLRERGWEPGERIGVANNPEFLREGYCWEDFIHADRIVLGVEDGRSEQMLRQLYEESAAPIICVTLNTGEFIKYLSNTLLATLISYSNEMSLIADTIGGIDTGHAFRVLHMDRRWQEGTMSSYAYPGCGYGGYCLPKDTNALYALTRDAGFDAPILKNVIATNDGMPAAIIRRIENVLGPEDSIGILGLSFKPGSDDVRDTPAAKIIGKLIDKGYKKIMAYDPVATTEFQLHYANLKIVYCTSQEELVERSDVLAIVTAWSEFKGLRERTEKPILDCRYIL